MHFACTESSVCGHSTYGVLAKLQNAYGSGIARNAHKDCWLKRNTKTSIYQQSLQKWRSQRELAGAAILRTVVFDDHGRAGDAAKRADDQDLEHFNP